MNGMNIKVLVLKDCKYCKELKERLEEIKRDLEANTVSTMFEDADNVSDYADYVESVLDTVSYPIVILERDREVYYIFKAEKHKSLGKAQIGLYDFKIGCLNVLVMFQAICEVLNIKK